MTVLWLDDVNAPASLAQLEKLEADLFLGAAYPQIFGKSLATVAAAGLLQSAPFPIASICGGASAFLGHPYRGKNEWDLCSSGNRAD
jgi:hypothetical protein